MDRKFALTERLVQAIQQENLVLAASLLEEGADPNLVLPSGVSPFHLAIGADTHNVLLFVKLLLQHNANPNIRSSDGMTPVHVAATWGRLQALNHLLVNGGNPELCDEEGTNAIDMAKDSESWDCLNLMRSYQNLEDPGSPEEDSSVIQNPLRERSGVDVENCSLNSSMYDSIDLSQDLFRTSLDSTRLSSYVHDASLSRSSFISLRRRREKKSLQRSFFPELDSINESAEKRKFETSTARNGMNCGPKTRPRNCFFQRPKSRISLEVEHRQYCKPTTLPESEQTFREDSILEESCSPSTVGQEILEKTEDDDENRLNRTLSSKYLEEVLMSSSSTGLDLTSPDHPAIFVKGQNDHSGVTPPLDKTIAFPPERRLTRYSSAGGQVTNLASVVPKAGQDSEISNVSGESSAYMTCQSDDTLASTDNRHRVNRKNKRHSRRVTFGSEDENTTYASAQGRNPEHSFSESAHGVNTCRCVTRGVSVVASDSVGLSNIFTEDESDLITSDEDTRFNICRGPESCRLEENWRESCQYCVNASDTENLELNRRTSTDSERLSNGHRLPKGTSDCSSRCESRLSDCREPDWNDKQDSVEYLYHDESVGAMLIERQCPSACSTATSHADTSELNYSQVSALDETVVYDWRDYQSDDSYVAPARVPLSEKLLGLTNSGIREMMRQYGEEAGPITATTRMVYLHHLAKLQNDPDFAQRAAKRHQTFQGFRWELAEYLNTGQLAEPDHKMVAEEQLMVAPFQKPDPLRKWREGTLKSSFNYILLDPRVTMDLPCRYTQLSQLETFRIFVAAIFYIGKGKRGRPYAHFYEALSAANPAQEAKVQTPRKAAKKQAGAKVRHILDIWAAGLGVVSLHCFQSVIPVEAYTREACMVDAMGLGRLTNVKKGDFYGPATTLPARKRRQMGVFLLKKACQIFLVEGERQIRPADIALGQ